MTDVGGPDMAPHIPQRPARPGAAVARLGDRYPDRRLAPPPPRAVRASAAALGLGSGPAVRRHAGRPAPVQR